MTNNWREHGGSSTACKWGCGFEVGLAGELGAGVTELDLELGEWGETFNIVSFVELSVGNSGVLVE